MFGECFHLVCGWPIHLISIVLDEQFLVLMKPNALIFFFYSSYFLSFV